MAYIQAAEVFGPEDELQHLADSVDMTSPEANLVSRFGREIRNLLCGSSNPLHLMFPGGDTAASLSFYQESEAARAINDIVASVGNTLASAAQSNGGLRILEVGGGTGASTQSLLRQLQGKFSHYCFSDVSSMFTRKAQDRFSSEENFSTCLLDVSAASEELVKHHESYDLVVAANVVHATADLETTLRNLNSFLVPGGYLILVEAEPGQDWLELIFGNMPGWWNFLIFVPVAILRCSAGMSGDLRLIELDSWIRSGCPMMLKVPTCESECSFS